MSLQDTSLWIGLLVLALLLIIAVRFIWPFNYLFFSKSKLVRQLSKKLLFLFVIGLFVGWGILAGIRLLNIERIVGLVVLILTGISCGVLIWWKIPQWINQDIDDKPGAEKFETKLDQINLFYDLKYKQKKWLEEKRYTKLGQDLLKDDKSRRYLVGLVSSIIFIIGLIIIYDIYVIDGDLPLLILPGITGILLGPIVFTIDRYLAREVKKFGHLLIKKGVR